MFYNKIPAFILAAWLLGGCETRSDQTTAGVETESPEQVPATARLTEEEVPVTGLEPSWETAVTTEPESMQVASAPFELPDEDRRSYYHGEIAVDLPTTIRVTIQTADERNVAARTSGTVQIQGATTEPVPLQISPEGDALVAVTPSRIELPAVTTVTLQLEQRVEDIVLTLR